MNSRPWLLDGLVTLVVFFFLGGHLAGADPIESADDDSATIAGETLTETLVAPVSIDLAAVDQELPPPRQEVSRIQPSEVDGGIESGELPAPHPSTMKPWVGAKLSNDRPEIISVVPKSPAYFAGLVSGDLVVSVQSKSVASTSEVLQRLASQHPGAQLKLNIIREGKRYSATLKLSSLYDRDVMIAATR